MLGPMADPFRTAVACCALCEREVEASSLELFAGVAACSDCREGKLERALARFGLRLTTRELRLSGEAGSLHRTVEVTRPTRLELPLKLEPDTPRGWLRRKLGARDPEIGVPAFDDRVKVIPDDESFTEAALEALRRPAVQQAVLAILDRGCRVELAGQSVWVHVDVREGGGLDAILRLEVMAPLAVALAIALERYARGEAA